MHAKKENYLTLAQQVLNLEGQAILKLANLLKPDYIEIIQLMAQKKGRVVVSGIGKSAIVAQKMVATFNSTGTPSIYMHAADAIHGDLGIVQPNDIVIIISKSGNTPEIKALVPIIKSFKNTLIAMVGNLNAYLAENADYILDTTVEKEACKNNLAPTTSTTAQMAMGDALAVCLQYANNFSNSDFARYHPGGALGKQLYLRVGEMLHEKNKAAVLEQDAIKKVLLEISSKRMGATAVLNQSQQVVGMITDGDIRRMLATTENISQIKAADIMNKLPKSVAADCLATEALNQMETHKITQLLVLDKGVYKGIVHLHDLIQEGIV